MDMITYGKNGSSESILASNNVQRIDLPIIFVSITSTF